MPVIGKKGDDARRKTPRSAASTMQLVTALVPMKAKGFISQKDVKGLLSGYFEAVKRAERTGRSVRLTVEVDPAPKGQRIAVEEVLDHPELDHALAAARLRGSSQAADILNGPDMLSADAFADEIGATRETVHKKRRRHEVLGLEGAKRGVRFPKWQVGKNGELLPGLPQLFEFLGEHPWSIYRFLLGEHDALDGRTALQALQAGKVEDVLAAADASTRGAFS